MATGSFSSSSPYCITVKHSDNPNLPIYVSGTATIDYVVKKAAAEFSLQRTDLVLIHQGNRLPPNELVQKVFHTTRTTCCFLKSNVTAVSNPSDSLRTAELTSSRIELGSCLGYCNTCNVSTKVRPNYSCSNCNEVGLAMDKAINQFEDDFDLIKGTCEKCQKSVKPIISYECRADDHEYGAIFLPHFRENVKKKPCMKCKQMDDHIIRFTCGHTMCMECFGVLCTTKLDADGFKTYPLVGYSVACPANGPMCKESPIADPHHFYLVDGNKKFNVTQGAGIKICSNCHLVCVKITDNIQKKFPYQRFKDKTFSVLQQEQREIGQIKCGKCHERLDLVQVIEAEVTPSEGATASTTTTQGGAWTSLLKFLKINQTQSQPRQMRRQIKCDNCQTLYCGECKLKWHEGNCSKLSSEQEAAANEFTIHPQLAQASLWD